MKTQAWLFRFLFIAVTCTLIQGCGPTYVAAVPSTPYYVQPASPYNGAVWIDGGWNYRRRQPVYYQGYWSQPRHGNAYQPGHWQQYPRGYRWRGGRWR